MSTPTPSQRETFGSRHGHALAGRAVAPGVPGVPGTGTHWVLLSHCFTCGKDLKGYHHLCRSLASAGWGSLRFDFTGLGASGGDFAATDLDSNIDDVEDAARHLAAQGRPPRLLIGHSLGGAAALLAAPGIPHLSGLVLIGAPSDLDHLPRAVPEIQRAARRGQPVQITIGGRRVGLGPGLLASLGRHDLEKAVHSLDLPLLLLHAPKDDVVPFSHAQRLAGWAKDRSTLVPLDGADHLLSAPVDAARAAGEIATWAQHPGIPA